MVFWSGPMFPSSLAVFRVLDDVFLPILLLYAVL